MAAVSPQGGVLPEGRILAGYYGFDANISLTFQAVKKLSAHPTYLCSGLFCNFLGIFWYIWRFPQRIYGNRNILRFGVVLKLEIGRCTANSCPLTWGAILGAVNYLVVFHNLFFLFNPS